MGLKDKNTSGALKPIPILLMSLLSLFLTFCTEIYLIIAGGKCEYTGSYPGYAKNVLSALSIKHLLVFFIVLEIACLAVYFFGRKLGDFIYKFRWFIGFATIIFAVIFELSGSSIGIWNAFCPDPSLQGDGVLLGQSRGIRSDEWAVHTPMTFSQYYSGFGVFGDIFRGSSTDMYMVYGQPVMDWSIIFRPFQIGYLFLSPAKGLSFYWVSKLVMLILVSFEAGMLITKKNKLLSLAYCVMMAFAPAVQWWFGTNFFPDMLVYGQGVVLCIAAYMKSDKYLNRILCGLGFIICGGAYLLVMYPAWQIPFFYVFLLMAIWAITEQAGNFKFCLKKDLPIICGSIALLGVCMMVIVLRSLDTVRSVMGTAYPGSRMDLGGYGISVFFKYPGTLFTPFTNAYLPLNESEMSSFFDLFPLGIILSLLVLFKDRVKDKLLIMLWTAYIFLGSYVVLGFPAALAKITLLSSSTAWRAFIALGFINVLMLIRSLATGKSSMKKYIALPIAAVMSVAITYYSKRLLYGQYFNKIFILISIGILFILFALTLCYKHSRFMRTSFCAAVCLVTLMTGILVNPLRSGTDVIDNNRLAKAVRGLQTQDAGLWIAENGIMDGNFIAMNGAPCINSTNTYPNLERWHSLDSLGQYEEIYNRYAHIIVTLTQEEPTRFALDSADVVHLYLNTDDLDILKPKYIMTASDLDGVKSDECSLTLVYSENDISRRIYRVDYAS